MRANAAVAPTPILARVITASTACLFALIPVSVAAQNAEEAGRVVLEGYPDTYSSCSKDGCERGGLDATESRESRVVIVERNGSYYWASRGGRELYHQRSGAFHLFIDLRGGGYVKVLDQRSLPDQVRFFV